MSFGHLWEYGSQKVNMNEPDLRIYHGNFWPVISHAVRKSFLRGVLSGNIHLHAAYVYAVWLKASKVVKLISAT